MIPFASMSNATSICGMPRGAGGIPTSWNLPSVLLYDAISDSPWSTCTSTEGWLSSAVVNDLRLLRRDRRVPLDQPGEHAALRLDAEAERGDVQEQDVRDLTVDHAGLDRGADCDDLVRVDALVRVLAGELLHLRLHRRHAGHAADEHDVLDLVRVRPASASACFVGRPCGRAGRRRAPRASRG